MIRACNTCGSSNTAIRKDGAVFCRDCKKSNALASGSAKKESGVAAPDCPVHNTSRYWNNYSVATCPTCNREKKNRLYNERKNGPPPTDCEIHNVPRQWSTEGHAKCKLCVKEIGFNRLKRYTEEGIKPKDCPKHNCERYWDAGASAKCNECVKESKRRSGEKKRNADPPSDCPTHNRPRYWTSEGTAACTKCNHEYRVNLKKIREQQSPPDPCIIHNQDKHWNAHGNAICNLCERDKAHALGLAKMQNGPPSRCEVHDVPRYWNIRGVAVCDLCKKEYAYLRGKIMMESGPPPKCSIHDEEQSWKLDGRTRCSSCEKEYRNSLDRLYYRWTSMYDRCHNEDNSGYANYGGRGIFVHESWRRDPNARYEENYKAYSRFREWMLDNIGDVPTDGRTLDRIDNNRGYEPGNLRWATKQEQVANRRVSVEAKTSVPDDSSIDYYGDTMTLTQLSELTSIHIDALKYRYAQYPAAIDWIISGEADNRYYEWNGEFYNLPELCIISGISYKTMFSRIRKQEWSVGRAMSEPLNR